MEFKTIELGYRIGKGEGYADIGYAIMRTMGAVNDDTIVVTTVHDCQVYDNLCTELFDENDLPVDFIVTPTRCIRCQSTLPKPKTIDWSLITKEQLNQIPILRILKKQNIGI